MTGRWHDEITLVTLMLVGAVIGTLAVVALLH